VVIVSVVDDTELAANRGAVDYLVKPVDPQVLLGWLARKGLVPALSDH
jgi:DNA-binding response OmpR family regulator